MIKSDLFRYGGETSIMKGFRIEGFRYMLLDTGTFSWNKFIYTLVIGVVVFL